MLIISKEQVDSLIHRLSLPTELDRCQEEVARMLEIKSALLWWAEAGKWCRWEPQAHFAGEIETLEKVLLALKQDNISEASSLLRDYRNQMAQKVAYQE